jgi:CheY-like chemotaxis protein
VIRSRGLSLTSRIDTAAQRTFLMDPLRLKQVLNNLLSNAIKFTAQGAVELRVHLQDAAAQGGQHLRFEVKDTGIGIPEDKRALIFDAFTQADQSTSRRHGGSGLGLTISQRLVRLMGGRIGLESLTGAGSIFWFELPAAPVDVEPVSSSAPRSSVPVAVAHVPDMATVAAGKVVSADLLVVEDHEVNQLVTTGMLRRLGYTSEIAADGHSALEKLGTKRYGVVLMDMQMPGMDGVEATRAWREREDPGSRLPIIAMTANVLSSDREICIDAGMDDFIGKPVHMDELRSKLERNLGTTQVYS